jgi:hypothetical protein
MKKWRRSPGTSTLFVLTARRQVGRPSLKVSAGSGGQPARLDAWSIAAAKGYDGRKRICRACVAQSRATSSVRTKSGRREKGSGIPWPGLVVACHSPTPIQFRSRPRASLTLHTHPRTSRHFQTPSSTQMASKPWAPMLRTQFRLWRRAHENFSRCAVLSLSAVPAALPMRAAFSVWFISSFARGPLRSRRRKPENGKRRYQDL